MKNQKEGKEVNNDPREIYYSLLMENHLVDYLSGIKELSYSDKTNILKNLLEEFDIATVNRALLFYRTEYIDVRRISLPRLKNTLKGICVIKKNDSYQ